MVYRRNLGALGTSFQPTMQNDSIPGSVGGINALDSLMGMPPVDCIYTYNLMPSEYGLRLRKGYREWGNGATGDIRTIIPYESNVQDPARDKLFCVTEDGIWDFTLFNTTAPVQEVVFSETGVESGYGVMTEFTNDASAHFLFYADALNGIHQYSEATGLWTVPTGWTHDVGAGSVPFPVGNVAFVHVHKLRIWVVLEDSDDAWYLPIASIAGELVKFTFGAKMIHGGNLAGLWTWTLDGGNGIDDYMIAISRGGDVMVYKGADPEATVNPWSEVGAWYIGELPDSRRLVAEHGAEMYILSTFGVSSLRDLLQGAAVNQLRTSPSAKINRFLRADVQSGKDKHEWALTMIPSDGQLQIIAPEPTNTPFIQYNQNLLTKAWGIWEGVPMICGGEWNAEYYVGGKDGVLWIYDGVLDGTTLSGDVGGAVTYRTLTSFQALQNHSTFKRVGFIRTIGVLAGTTSINVKAVYDYKIESEVLPPNTVPSQGQNVWDSALWDTDLWDFGVEGQSFPVGTLGMGRVLAIAIRGNATTRINVVGWDVTFTRGGFL